MAEDHDDPETVFHEAVKHIEEASLEQGIIFDPAFKMLQTGRIFIVPLAIDKADLIKPFQELTDTSNGLVRLLNSPRDRKNCTDAIYKAIKTNLGRLVQTLDKRKSEVIDLVDSMADLDTVSTIKNSTISRVKRVKKRAIFGIIGAAINLVNGITSQVRLTTLHSKIKNLNLNQQALHNITNVHSQILTTQNRDLNKLKNAQEKLQTQSM